MLQIFRFCARVLVFFNLSLLVDKTLLSSCIQESLMISKFIQNQSWKKDFFMATFSFLLSLCLAYLILSLRSSNALRKPRSTLLEIFKGHLREITGYRRESSKEAFLFEQNAATYKSLGLQKAPTLYVSRDQDVNAMAFGDKHCGSIIFTEGLLYVMDNAELSAVLYHEMAHLAFDDCHTLNKTSALEASLYAAFWVGIVHILIGSKVQHLSLLVFSSIFGFLIYLIVRAIRRKEGSLELRADLISARVGGPAKMLNVLLKLKKMETKPSQSLLALIHPLSYLRILKTILGIQPLSLEERIRHLLS